MDLIHLDVCGPMIAVSLSGYHYYVTFIDDFSRKTWIYFVNKKDVVFCRFKEFKALVENRLGERSRHLASIMEASTPRMTSRTFVHVMLKFKYDDRISYYGNYL